MKQKMFTTRKAAFALLSMLLSACVGIGVVTLPKSVHADEGEGDEWTLVDVPADKNASTLSEGYLAKSGWFGEEEKVVPDDYKVSGTSVTIASADALAYFAHEVTLPQNNGFSGYKVSLECNVNLEGNLWIPIGFSSRKDSANTGAMFMGEFDGNGNTVYNLTSKAFYENVAFDETNETFSISCGEGLSIPFPTDRTDPSWDNSKKYWNTCTGEIDFEFTYGLFGVTANATINNLNVAGVKFSFSDKVYGDYESARGTANTEKNFDVSSIVDGNVELGKYRLMMDNVGAIVGYNSGSLTMTNCTAGVEGDYIKAENTLTSATVAGLVARIYAGNGTSAAGFPNGSIAGTPSRGTVRFENCANYIDVEIGNKCKKLNEKAAGILGYSIRAEGFTFINCVNYGDMVTGKYGYAAGGIVSYHVLDGDVTTSYKYENCINYGNVVANSYAGGITGAVSNPGGKGKQTTEIANCYNYGNVSGVEDGSGGSYGGIVSYLYIKFDNDSVKVTDCFNYGDVTDLGVAGNHLGTGALVGYVQIEPNVAYTAEISGGNSGTVSGKNAGKYNQTNLCIGHNRYVAQVLTCEYLVDASSKTGMATDNSGEAAGVATLKMDGTTVVGVENVPEGNFSVEIGGNVTAIAPNAFIGLEKLVAVTFTGSSLKEIGDFAFSGTGINNLTIPAGVTKIGTAAFANCAHLNYIKLPAAAENITYGNSLVSNGAYIIAADNAQYNAVSKKCSEKTLTYVVTIEYTYNDNLIDSEERLYGFGYGVAFNATAGRWATISNPTLGTAQTAEVSTNWSAGNGAVTVDGLSALINGESAGDVIRLYTLSSDKKVFIAREDLVYDGKEYGLDELNPLLYYSSDLITRGMVVEIKTYNGAATDKTKVGDAGEYVLTIKDGAENYELTINIAKAKVDLSSYANLSLQANGKDLSDMTLYLYTYTDAANAGKYYPSNVVLSSGQVNSLGLNPNYTVQSVLYSAIRGTGSKINLAVKENAAYTASLTGDISVNGVGAYRAQATLTPNGNYEFVLGGTINTLRGINVELNDNGTASVTKNWYVVELSNWLVGAGGDYTIVGHEYLGNVTAVAPQLHYTGEGGEITMQLYLNGGLIGDAQGFGVADFDKYICSAMPAGNYRLVINVTGVTTKEYDEFNNEIPDSAVFHDGFTETVEFTVSKKALPAFTYSSSLNGQTFKYIWEENTSHLYTAGVAQLVNAYLADIPQPDLSGKIWEEYSGTYYGNAEIKFNLARMQSDSYASSIETNMADEYTVYYMFTAPSYYTSIENLTSGVRQQYYFKVINVREIPVPTIANKVYNGEGQSADIADGIYYTVDLNPSVVNAGTYTVTLRLRSEYYIWEGASLEEVWVPTKGVNFVIDKADNSWTETLGITTWTVGQYDKLELEAGEFTLKAAAKYGDVKITLVNASNPDKVLYRGANGSTKLAEVLAGLEVGTYYITATVDADANQQGITASIFFKVFPKEGLAWWAILLIVIAALGVVALILWLLHEKGVLQMISGKVMISIRTKMTMDATIAAVRANMVAEQSRKTREAAQRAERLEAARRAREEARSLPLDEQAAALDAKAQEADAKAAKMRQQAERMKKRAEAARGNSAQAPVNPEAQAEQTIAADEKPSDGTPETPDSTEE